MSDPTPGNHAVADWLAGKLSPEERDAFEAHLDGCPDCQAEVGNLRVQARKERANPTVKVKVLVPPPETPPPRNRMRRIWLLILGIAVVIVVVGYLLGAWAWQIAH